MLNLSKLFCDGRPLLSSLMLCFAASAVGDLDAGAADPAAVIAGDVTDVDPDAQPLEADADAQADPDAQADTDKQDDKPVITAPQVDGRQVPAKIRNLIAEVKKTDPATAKELNDYVWGYKNLKADIAKNFGPEGLKEAIALKATVEELTGADSVEQFKEEVQGYRQFDQQFINGDPEFIKAAVAQYPEGFKKLAPAMLDTWAQADPDAYDRRMSGIIVATLNQNQFGNNEARAIDFLEMKDPDKTDPVIQKAIALLSENQKSLAGWDQFSKSKPKAPEVDPNAAANAKAKADLDQREARMFAGGVTKDLDTFSTDKIGKELGALKKSVPESARPVFDKQVIDAVWVKMREEPNFTPKLRALMANKDHAGVMKFLKSKSELHYVDAVEATYKRLYGTAKLGSPKPKPVTGKPAVNGAPNKPAAGWVKFNPPAELIDRKLTSERDMVILKKAILKDGRKVWWGKEQPTA